jgi:hypothetical protein
VKSVRKRTLTRRPSAKSTRTIGPTNGFFGEIAQKTKREKSNANIDWANTGVKQTNAQIEDDNAPQVGKNEGDQVTKKDNEKTAKGKALTRTSFRIGPLLGVISQKYKV